ncbi:MarR family winged helix-turn-helix transcriptional regulator [Microbacter sp. GSS18]|nr:MarR family winged helix-turn-helix transcriptional regulator [Microbacter sp. GSS18]
MADELPRATVLQHPGGLEGVATEPLPTALPPEEFTPRLLTLLSNVLVSAQAQGFRTETGRSTNEWRILAAVAATPGQSASEIAESLSINKSLISPTVNRLAEEGLIVLVGGPRGSRPMYLTPDGVRVHDLLAPIAQRGQDLITAELGEDDVRALNAILRRLLARARDGGVGGADRS